MMTYRYNNTLDIIETVIKGEITIDYFIKHIKILSKKSNLPKKLKILTDARDAKFSKNTKPEDLHKIAEANNKYLLNKSSYHFDAFIISGSLETALGYLYKEYSRADNYSFTVFSTRKAAVEWLENI